MFPLSFDHDLWMQSKLFAYKFKDIFSGDLCPSTNPEHYSAPADWGNVRSNCTNLCRGAPCMRHNLGNEFFSFFFKRFLSLKFFVKRFPFSPEFQVSHFFMRL